MDKQLERLMMKAYAREAQDSVYYKAMIKSHQFWQAEDYYHKSNKAKIFKSMYMLNGLETKSLFQISLNCYVDERTLFRYRNDFIQMYKYFVKTV